MWRLSKLDIRGFKSFAEQAHLVFPEGITAVVGPNGCGKSNISDAIVWALGEQSTSVLRAQQMQDVIFQGTASRKATGFAEVTLHLTTRGENGNGNGAGPAGDELFDAHDDAELSITRRLYRSGDSEYLMNGEKRLLREIRERLLGTGLGYRACFTIGQGRIDQILSASPLERRAPIEEAAGISLYRRRRHRTNLKLEGTAQDLSRVEDICAEVARQMRSLKRQAGRARRYKEFRDRLRGLEHSSFSLQALEAESARDLAAAALQAARLSEKTVRQQLDDASSAWEAARRAWRDQRQAQAQQRQRMYDAQVEHERARSEAARLRDRSAYAIDRVQDVERKLEEVQGSRAASLEILQVRLQAAEEAETAARSAERLLQEAHERLDPLLHLENKAAGPKTKVREKVLELQPLAAGLTVEAEARGAVALVLGHRLRQPVLDGEDLTLWMEAVAVRRGLTRGLRKPDGKSAQPEPPVAGLCALAAAVQTDDPTAGRIVAELLRDTWMVGSREEALELAAKHAEHAFVDVGGSVWARGAEIVLRNEIAIEDAIEESSRRSQRLTVAAAEAKQQRPVASLPSPALEAARIEVDQTAASTRAARSQAAAAAREQAAADTALRQIDAEIERLQGVITSLQDASAKALEAAASSDKVAEAAAKRCDALEKELQQEESADVAGEAEIAGFEAAVTAARTAVERAQEMRSTADVQAAEVRVARSHLHGRIRDRLDVEPDELLSAARAASPEQMLAAGSDGPALQQEIREVKTAIDKLGPVNLVAYEDYETQQERFGELDGQRRDLVDAAGNLREAIRRIDAECVERFATAFEAIDGYFNRIMRQLFGGGRAGMRLENPDDPLNSGIEIMAQPPGKNLQSIRLLSGGERSMIALALMFAIFEYHPAPFCILDEADAALDESNVERFVQALHHFQDRAQFIMITHNKLSMEVADLLYGVTMEESGVSKLVGVALT